MSTTITRGTTLGGTITRQDLWNLIANSQLTDVDVSALSLNAQSRMLTAASEEPATMAPGQMWWDMSTQLMRVFDHVSDLALAVGPDRFEMPVIAGYPINRGMAVCVDAVATYSLYGNAVGIPVVRPPVNSVDGVHVLGIAADTATSGAFCPIAYAGLVPALFGASLYRAAYAINEVAVVASGYTGLLGVAPAVAAATLTWAVGNLIEMPRATVASNYSQCLYIRFCGPWKGRRYFV